MSALICPTCSSPISAGGRFCAACGAALPSAAADLPPATEDFTSTPHSDPLAFVIPVKEQRFTPGQMLAGRYRIVAALGVGGMGEVYRADDLTLNQAVALKFLPRELGQDADRLARLRAEVRIARQIAHVNVCRVYDIGAAECQPFLTMEYIDGEDLAALLKKVGRLPEDKGVGMARQICLGLAAAHDQGVIHRDLKPQNIMLDSWGRVRITDFGLAAHADEIDAVEIHHGTPAYQAPEQVAGTEITVQSDIYALHRSSMRCAIRSQRECLSMKTGRALRARRRQKRLHIGSPNDHYGRRRQCGLCRQQSVRRQPKPHHDNCQRDLSHSLPKLQFEWRGYRAVGVSPAWFSNQRSNRPVCSRRRR